MDQSVNDNFYRRLLTLPLFQGMARADFLRLAGRVRFDFRTLAKNEIIAHQSEPCRNFIFIVDGTFSASMESFGGKFRLCEWCDIPSLLDAHCLYGLSTKYERTYRAESKMSLFELPKNIVFEELMRLDTFRLNYLNLLSKEVQNVHFLLWRNNAKNELLYRFVQLLLRFSLFPSGRKEVYSRHVDIAEMLGVPTLRVSAMLNTLVKDGMLVTHRNRVVVPEMKSLVQFAGIEQYIPY